MSTNEEQNELMELVEEQSDVIKEIAINQNALIALLLNKGFIDNAELESARDQIRQTLDEA